MKKYKTILIFLFLFILIFIYNFFSIANNDLIWNYGFCHNVAKGLKMYKDFNMVITPLYPSIFGIIMKLLGNNTIIFYLSNALMPTIILYLIYKYYNKAFIESILLVLFVSNPNYNLLCLLILFILFILEDKKKNDYLIGIVLALAFLTKSSMGVLTLASLYYIKDVKKIFKRFIGFLIPNILYILYFYLNGNLFDYINYAFGSLIDFATKNARSGIGVVIFIISVIYIIYLFKKKKDIKLLYILGFQILSYPIFNGTHILQSAVPLLIYIVQMIDNKYYLKYKKILLVFTIAPILAVICQILFVDLKWGTNSLKYKLVETKYIKDANLLKEKLNNLDNTYFIIYEGYYNKLLLNIPINKYDVMLSGNLGYKGEEKTIEYFDKQPMGTKFVLYKGFEDGQVPLLVDNHIRKNYKLKQSFDKYDIYIK